MKNKNKYLTLFLVISIALYTAHILFSQYFSKENMIVDTEETNKFVEPLILHDEVLNYEMKNTVTTITTPINLTDSLIISGSALGPNEREKIIPIPTDVSGSDIIPLNR